MSGRQATHPRGFIPGVVMQFNLILIVVAVVLAVLIPRVFDGKARRTDRQRLSAALSALIAPQTAYHAAHGSYARSAGALGIAEAPGAPRVVRADSLGWVATMASDHVLRPRVTCGVYDGPATFAPDPAVTRPREVACWGVWLWVKRTRE